MAMPNDIQKKLANLPEKVQAILFDPETSATIGRIGLNYKLMVDKIGILAEETTLTILGVARTKDFAGRLMKRLDIDLETAGKIAADINEQIFVKIREELQKLDNAPAGAPVAPEPKPYTPPAAPGAPGAGIKNYESGIKEEVITPVQTITQPAPVIPPKIETTPFEHKLKEDEIFRAPAVISEHEAPEPGIKNYESGIKESAGKQTLSPLPKKEEIHYAGKDPYREPIQ